MNKIILQHEIVDAQLRELGLDGYVDPNTGLFLPHAGTTDRLLTSREIHATNNTGTKKRRPKGKNMVPPLPGVSSNRR